MEPAEMLHPKLTHRFHHAPGLLRGVRLRKHATVRRAAGLRGRVGCWGAGDLEVEDLEFMQRSSLFQRHVFFRDHWRT